MENETGKSIQYIVGKVPGSGECERAAMMPTCAPMMAPMVSASGHHCHQSGSAPLINWTMLANYHKATKLSNCSDIQDTNDNFLLLNNLLNFEDQGGDCEQYLDSLQDKEWLDLIDFKEEPTYFDEGTGPRSDSERKIKHNKIERARRLFIDAKIRELGLLLPKQNEAYYELAKEIKHNKGGILRATVTFVKILKSDHLKKQRLEDICRLQNEQIEVMLAKIREYEAEMRSYEIDVKEFFMEDPPDYGDVFIPTPVPILTKKKIKKEKEALKSFEQVDLADDDVEMVGGKDPMLSSVDSKEVLARSRSRSLSSDSINDIEPLVYNKQRKTKALKREPRAKKAQNQSRAPVPMLPQLYNSPRIPVVSRPVFPKMSSSSITFPLPKGLKDLPSVSSIYSTSSSSEDEPINSPTFNKGFDEETRRTVSVSVIKKVEPSQRASSEGGGGGGDTVPLRPVILQEHSNNAAGAAGK